MVAVDSVTAALVVPLGVVFVGVLTWAVERGAGRRFPEWDRFLDEVGWILVGFIAAVYVIVGFFLLLGRYG